MKFINGNNITCMHIDKILLKVTQIMRMLIQSDKTLIENNKCGVVICPISYTDNDSFRTELSHVHMNSTHVVFKNM